MSVTVRGDVRAPCSRASPRSRCRPQIEFRDELPKTMIGKLSKKELKAEEDAKRAA